MTLSEKKRPSKISNPIPIGHHTVSGHEASALAKRLNEELASQQSASGPTLIPRALSPDCEPISRSFEHGKSKGNIFYRLEVRLVQISILIFLNFLNFLLLTQRDMKSNLINHFFIPFEMFIVFVGN